MNVTPTATRPSHDRTGLAIVQERAETLPDFAGLLTERWFWSRFHRLDHVEITLLTSFDIPRVKYIQPLISPDDDPPKRIVSTKGLGEERTSQLYTLTYRKTEIT